jgi:hypothetical protein
VKGQRFNTKGQDLLQVTTVQVFSAEWER